MEIEHPAAAMGRPHGPREWHASPLRRAATLAPFALALALSLLARSYFGIAAAMPPDISGIPLGMVAGGIVLAWAALGALIVWTTGSRTAASLALVFITLPSMLAVIFTPAVILVLQKLP